MKLSRRELMVGVSTLALTRGADAAFAIFQVSGSITQPAFSSAAFQAQASGGEVILSVCFSNDGTLISTTNQAGPWLYNSVSAQWDRVINPTTLSGKFSTTGAPNATEGIFTAIAPSNSNYMSCWFDGVLYYSQNKGATWTATSLTSAFTDPQQLQGPLIAYDPVNPLKVVACGVSNTSYSLDGGATYTSISGLAAATTNSVSGIVSNIVVFDPSSSTGGSTPTVYIGVNGTGWYKSTTGVSGTFNLTTSTPTTAGYNAACDGTGHLYALTSADAVLHIFNGTTWSSVTISGGNSIGSVAVDPVTANRLVVGELFGQLLNVSTNNGTSWGGWSTSASLAAGDVTWLGLLGSTANYRSIAFHPTISNLLYAATGGGVFTTSPTNAPSAQTLTGTNNGIQMGVTFMMCSPPSGGPAITAQWDHPFIPVYPVPGPSAAAYLPTTIGAGGLYQGYAIDWAPNSSFIAGIAQYANSNATTPDISGYSLNGGQTWINFTTNPPLFGSTGSGQGGSIAVCSPTNMCRVGTSDSSNPVAIYYTTNQGVTWTASTGAPTSGWSGNYYDTSQLLVADKVNAGTFYAVNGNGSVYSSTNSGATWSAVGTLSVSTQFSSLQSVPGQAGHIFHSETLGNALQYSLNGGVTWASVSGVTCQQYGFGKAAPGKSYPTIYMAGTVSGVYGIWRGVSNSPTSITWVNYTASTSGYPNPPMGEWPWRVIAISGDNTAYGWAYLGWSNVSWLYCVSNDAAPWGTFTSPAQNATISGTINLTVAVAADISCTSVQFQVDAGNVGSPVTPSAGSATLSYSTSGLASGTHTISAILTGNGQTTTVSCYVTK